MEEYLDKLPQPERVKGVAMDMHEPFRQAVRMCLPGAKIVVDKFHLIRHINEAVDKARSRVQGGSGKGKRRDLFKSRYILLKGTERLNSWEKARLNRLFLAPCQSTGSERSGSLRKAFEDGIRPQVEARLKRS